MNNTDSEKRNDVFAAINASPSQRSEDSSYRAVTADGTSTTNKVSRTNCDLKDDDPVQWDQSVNIKGTPVSERQKMGSLIKPSSQDRRKSEHIRADDGKLAAIKDHYKLIESQVDSEGHH